MSSYQATTYQLEKNVWWYVFAGVLIGFGGILPGVSGAVLAVSLGIYRPMLDSLTDLRRNFRASARYLLPLFAGAAIGFLLGAVLLNKLMVNYTTPLLIIFTGLICGGIPAFLREANSDGFRPRWLIAAALGAVLAGCLLFLDTHAAAMTQGHPDQTLLWYQYLIAGAIVAVGAVVPGISTSFILLYMGWYGPMLSAVTGFVTVPCLLMGAGVAVFLVLTVKFVRRVFDRCGGWAYYTVLGFLLGTVALVISMVLGKASWWTWLLIVPSLAAGYLLTRKSKD
ncbi:MAG: DUF368 domain-containing protein [Firmicutes bacterium]|nr:DUF368 domain-containing protein [Bacillota bacterium]